METIEHHSTHKFRAIFAAIWPRKVGGKTKTQNLPGKLVIAIFTIFSKSLERHPEIWATRKLGKFWENLAPGLNFASGPFAKQMVLFFNQNLYISKCFDKP